MKRDPRLFHRALRSAERFRAEVEVLIEHLDALGKWDALCLREHLDAYLAMLTVTEQAIAREAPLAVTLV